MSKTKYSVACIKALCLVIVFLLSLFVLSLLPSGPNGYWHLPNRPTFRGVLSKRSAGGVVSPAGLYPDANLLSHGIHSCTQGKPCANGACCSSTGQCGYGPQYCDKGCISNCNVTAECGKHADPPWKHCPLNVCCSVHGSCGTTTEFCKEGCQSNCILDPVPPNIGNRTHHSQQSNVLDKVVGYYEAWSRQPECHKIKPQELPLESLTHVNVAFAAIEPESFKVVVPNTEVSNRTFLEVADLKRYKPELKVFVSIGGWAVSNDGTATQEVFGNISASDTNRRIFAANVLKFLNQYGFDGVDIDWEYPASPETGGRPRDTENFVLLLETLRSVFNGSRRHAFGLTFTIPSSYQHLKGFDLPKLSEAADWINLMAYDLNGAWDKTYSAGNSIQAHTNLTEIQQSVNLLWRVHISPSKIMLGFAFYGRTYQLKHSDCTKPGCQFSAAGHPGKCSAISGVLSYIEIASLLQDNPHLKPVHDSRAAVKYLAFDKDQWLSYDDQDTFKQKIDWANKIGLGGVMTWASNLANVITHDTHHTAHSKLLGQKSPKTAGPLGHLVGADPFRFMRLIGDNGQSCRREKTCFRGETSTCDGGRIELGWDRGKCKGSLNQPICCSSQDLPKLNATWRGGGLDCDGQCHIGEVTLEVSKKGGGYKSQSGTSGCNRGVKNFCAHASKFNLETAGCYWSDCGEKCRFNHRAIIKKHDNCYQYGGRFYKSYCCPEPTYFHGCYWEGSGDCADNRCARDDITIDIAQEGGGKKKCNWFRKKTGCCKQKPPSKSVPFLRCPNEDWDTDKLHPVVEARDASKTNGSVQLTKRGNPRKFKIDLKKDKDGDGDEDEDELVISSRPYPSASDFWAQLDARDRRIFNLTSDDCGNTEVTWDEGDHGREPDPHRADTEHPLDLQVHKRFLECANSGNLPMPNEGKTKTSPISSYYFQKYYNTESLERQLDPVTEGSPDQRVPSDRVFEAFGSNTNRQNLILASKTINQYKNRLFDMNRPIRRDLFRGSVNSAVSDSNGWREEQTHFLNVIRGSIAVFRYVNGDGHEGISAQYLDTVRLIREQLELIECEHSPEAQGLVSLWDEFLPSYQRQVVAHAREWIVQQINYAEGAYRNQYVVTSERTEQLRTTILRILDQYKRDVQDHVHFPEEKK